MFLMTSLIHLINQGGLYTALPYIGASIVGALAGPCADFIRSRQFLSATKTRKLFNGVCKSDARGKGHFPEEKADLPQSSIATALSENFQLCSFRRFS